MPKNEAAIAEIKALEDRRYRAMLAGDMAVLDELCSDDLIYTHSKADYDDKRSYLHKVGTRYFTYLEITHPADRILVVDGAALVTGRMTAKVSVAGTIVHVDNRYLAVWVRERWRLEVCCGRSSTADVHRAPRVASMRLPGEAAPGSALEVFSALRGRGRGFRTDCMKATAEQDGNELEIHWTQRSPPPSANHSGRQGYEPTGFSESARALPV